MARRRNYRDPTKIKIICDRGEIFVQGAGLSVYYRYRRWFLKINPVLLFPGFRKEHRKIIYVNGKKRGYAELRMGCIPLPDYYIDGQGLSGALRNFVRMKLGLGCRASERGYYKIYTMNLDYIVLKRFTKEQNIHCQVYRRDTGEKIGTFLYDKDCTTIYPSLAEPRLVNTFIVIMGYVTDSVLYSTVASKLNSVIELKNVN